MRIHMNCGNQHLTVTLEDYPVIPDVIHVDFGRSFAKKTVHTDNEGKCYFVWNHQRMYLDYLKDYNMTMIQDRIEKKEYVVDNELVLAIINDGVDNVRFITPCNKRSEADIFGLGVFTNETEDVVCKIREDRYTVLQNYKIGITPEQPTRSFAGRDYYMSDFLSLIKSGHIKILVNQPQSV